MFAHYEIKNKYLKYTIILLFLIIFIPIFTTILDIIRIYGVMIGSIARYVITTNTLF